MLAVILANIFMNSWMPNFDINKMSDVWDLSYIEKADVA